jgi:hypothetical protein
MIKHISNKTHMKQVKLTPKFMSPSFLQVEPDFDGSLWYNFIPFLKMLLSYADEPCIVI